MARKFFVHYRLYDAGSDKMKARGGATAYVCLKDDGVAVFGVAICSIKQNFCKKVGRQVADAALRGFTGSGGSVPGGSHNPDLLFRALDKAVSKAFSTQANLWIERTTFSLKGVRIDFLSKEELRGLLKAQVWRQLGVDLEKVEIRRVGRRVKAG